MTIRWGKNVGTLCSTCNVEVGICTLEWVYRSFSLVILIGKSNTPLLRMYSCFSGFEKVPVCVLVSSKLLSVGEKRGDAMFHVEFGNGYLYPRMGL